MTTLNTKQIFTFFILVITCACLVSCANFKKSVKVNQTTINKPQPVKIHNVTALLPLKDGELAANGKAIRDGILTAYYADNDKKDKNNLNINIIDTTGKNVMDLYNQSVANKADLIIGPLTKPDVSIIASQGKLPIPTIALNTLDNYKNRVVPNLYQFGLSPQDEAEQTATKMSGDKHLHVEIIAPDNAWGRKIANTFTNKFKETGGQITASLYYNQNTDLDVQIKNSIQTGVDGIFLVATPQNGRQIVPLLKFYHTTNLPAIYATSTIYSGVPNPNLDQDLNGIIFCDMPWTIEDVTNLPPRIQRIHNQVTSEWQDSFANNSRLYALGADAYHIMIYFNNLIESPSVKIRGATGILNIDRYNHVVRTLNWAEFKNGIPVEL